MVKSPQAEPWGNDCKARLRGPDTIRCCDPSRRRSASQALPQGFNLGSARGSETQAKASGNDCKARLRGLL